jgi:hypothetical protein
MLDCIKQFIMSQSFKMMSRKTVSFNACRKVYGLNLLGKCVLSARSARFSAGYIVASEQ